MRTIISVCLFCLLSTGLVQAGLLTGTICVPSVTDNIPSSASSSSACDVEFPGIWLASASMSGDLGSPAPGSPSTSAGASFTATAAAIATDPSVSAATAGALGTANLQLATIGAVRNGFIEIFEQMSGLSNSEIPPPMTANIAVGALQTSCNLIGNGASCTGNLGPTDGNSVQFVQPFTLGQSFTFSESVGIIATSASSFMSDITSGTSSVDFSFSFLESDGKTPVEIFLVPEPATWGLIISGLIAMCGLRKKGVKLPLG